MAWEARKDRIKAAFLTRSRTFAACLVIRIGQIALLTSACIATGTVTFLLILSVIPKVTRIQERSTMADDSLRSATSLVVKAINVKCCFVVDHHNGQALIVPVVDKFRIGIPLASQSFGYILIRVNPGIVLISLR